MFYCFWLVGGSPALRSMSGFSLLPLPIELFYQVLKHSDLRSIARLALTDGEAAARILEGSPAMLLRPLTFVLELLVAATTVKEFLCAFEYVTTRYNIHLPESMSVEPTTVSSYGEMRDGIPRRSRSLHHWFRARQQAEGNREELLQSLAKHLFGTSADHRRAQLIELHDMLVYTPTGQTCCWYDNHKRQMKERSQVWTAVFMRLQPSAFVEPLLQLRRAQEDEDSSSLLNEDWKAESQALLDAVQTNTHRATFTTAQVVALSSIHRPFADGATRVFAIFTTLARICKGLNYTEQHFMTAVRSVSQTEYRPSLVCHWFICTDIADRDLDINYDIEPGMMHFWEQDPAHSVTYVRRLVAVALTERWPADAIAELIDVIGEEEGRWIEDASDGWIERMTSDHYTDHDCVCEFVQRWSEVAEFPTRFNAADQDFVYAAFERLKSGARSRLALWQDNCRYRSAAPASPALQ